MNASLRFVGAVALSAALASVVACGNGDDDDVTDGGGGGTGTGTADSGSGSGSGGGSGTSDGSSSSCTIPSAAPPMLSGTAGSEEGCFTEPTVVETCVINGGTRKCTSACSANQYEVVCSAGSSAGTAPTPAASLDCTSTSGAEGVPAYCCSCGD